MRSFGSADFLILLFALRWTVLLTLVAFAGGGAGGAAVALARVSRLRQVGRRRVGGARDGRSLSI